MLGATGILSHKGGIINMATTITIEDVKKAKSYIPAATKEYMARLMAKLIVRPLENDAGEDGKPLPPIRTEDRLRRAQCLHGVLAGWYFGANYENEKITIVDEDGNRREEELHFVMSVGALDEWLDGHPMNQLERLKKEKQIANKVYDILYDFKAFELTLNGAVRERMEMANDPAIRRAQMLAMQSSPEILKETISMLEEYKKETEKAEQAEAGETDDG